MVFCLKRGRQTGVRKICIPPPTPQLRGDVPATHTRAALYVGSFHALLYQLYVKVKTRETKLETQNWSIPQFPNTFVNQTSTVSGVQSWSGKLNYDPSCSLCDDVLNKMIQSKL